MKVSKKRLIEIVTEEISRMRKEAWGDDPGHYRQRTTYAGQSHDKFMSRGAHDEAPRRSGRPRRRKPVAPRPEPSPEEKHAQQLQFAKDAGFGDGFSYGGSKHRHHYEHDPDLVAAYDARNAVGLERHRAFHAARNKTVSEGTWDERGSGSRSERIRRRESQAVEDAESDDMDRDNPFYEKDYMPPRIEDLHSMGITGEISDRGPLPSENPKLGADGIYWVRRWEMDGSLDYRLRFQTDQELQDEMMRQWELSQGA